MTRYTVINKYDLTILIAEINILIKKGWKPQGGVGVAIDNHNRDLYATTYCQAMVKVKDKP